MDHLNSGFAQRIKLALTYTYEHPRPSLTVDVAIFTIRDEQLNVLLVQRAHSPFQGLWALPGGFVEMDEALEHAAARELEEETGVGNAYLEQLYTYGDPGRDPRGRVVSVAYFALLPCNSLHQGEAGSDAAQVGWFPVEAVPKLAFDHTEILDYATHRLRYKLETSAVGFQLMPDEFTLSELQHTYELVLGAKLEPRSFQRRMLQAGFMESTSHVRSSKGRLVKLYRFKPEAVEEVRTRRCFP